MRHVGIVIALALALLPMRAIAAIAHVGTDTAFASNGSVTTMSLTVSQVPGQGHMLLIFVQGFGCTSVTMPDSSWTKQIDYGLGSNDTAVYTRTVQSGDTSTNMGTITLGASCESSYHVSEWSGVNNASPVSGTWVSGSVAGGSCNPSCATSSITPSAANAQPVASMFTLDTANTLGANTGWNGTLARVLAHGQVIGQYDNTTVSGATSATFTYGSSSHTFYYGFAMLAAASGSTSTSGGRLLMGCCK